jgi:G2/mitotic-specific cyclin-B, other
MQREDLESKPHMYPSGNCLASQTEITERMRKVLIDWLVEVHVQFKLLPETLFIAVNLIDRFCEKNQVKRKNYQLVGVTCMLIAAKYEEIYPPYVKEFIYITDLAYTKEQILETEVQVLDCLGFNMTWPTPLRFLERYSKLVDSGNEKVDKNLF